MDRLARMLLRRLRRRDAGIAGQAVGVPAWSPRVVDVTVVLQVARAVAECDSGLVSILVALRRPAPVVTIAIDDDGFAERVLNLLRDGVLLPGAVDLTDMISRFGRKSFDDARLPGRRALVLNSVAAGDQSEFLDEVIEKGAAVGHAILHLSDPEHTVPSRIASVSDLDLRVAALDWTVLADITAVILGADADADADADAKDLATRYPTVVPKLLSLSDLALAIRPGRSVKQVFTALTQLTAIHLDDDSGEGTSDNDNGEPDDKTTRESKAKTASKDTSSSGSSSSETRSGRGKDKGSGSELIEPVPGPDAATTVKIGANGESANQAAYLSIETLAGYGEAQDWALDLKADLDLWRAGSLDWSAMSTRLLLSGPPGTGKTTFARALCNTLQIPMLVTSVATWLEPGYLGDVVRRMRTAFEEATANAPVILFVDEIDGIGKRSDSPKDFTDYWNSVVNRALELLDGAVRTSGVIVVGATNRPGDIDPALLRSGRLEKQITIPLPDVTALVGILQHHLGDELAQVIATAPPSADRHPPETGPTGTRPGSPGAAASNDVRTEPDDAKPGPRESQGSVR